MNHTILDQIKKLDYATVRDDIEGFVLDHLEKTGAKKAIMGLSGGIDSAVLAYVCKERLKDRTVALVMPDTSITPNLETEDAMKMISLTGIEHKLIDIEPIVREYKMYLEPNEQARGNLRARIRTNILYYYANAKNYLVLGSSDKSEYNLGYFTKYGDGASDITPIISLYKLQVRELARFLKVPENIISKKSSPHLWKGHDAETELGATYEEVDSVLYCMIDKKMTVEDASEVTGIDDTVVKRILRLHQNSKHKRLPPQRLGVP